MRPAQSDAVDRAAAWYRERHFWSVHVVGDAVLLPLGRGIVAFEVPAGRAICAQEVLERNDIDAVALFVEQPDPHIIFLADGNGSVFGQFQMPSGVRYLAVPVSLRLPLSAASPTGDRRWFRTPDASRRWLPCAAAVLAAINAVTPYALRACGTPAQTSKGERVVIG
jgi:hypothetical protein